MVTHSLSTSPILERRASEKVRLDRVPLALAEWDGPDCEGKMKGGGMLWEDSRWLGFVEKFAGVRTEVPPLDSGSGVGRSAKARFADWGSPRNPFVNVCRDDSRFLG